MKNPIDAGAERRKNAGMFHVVRFSTNNKTRSHEIFFENKPYLRVNSRFRGMSRQIARKLCKLLNGEARWPS